MDPHTVNTPAYLESTILSGPREHLAAVKSAIDEAQHNIFKFQQYPSGVRKPSELVAAVYSLYARAVRDLTQRDSLYGGRVNRGDYVFAINQSDFSWILSSGLFDLREIYAGSTGQIIKTIDGLAFAGPGRRLLDQFENNADFMIRYSRSGLYQRLINIKKNPAKEAFKNLMIELTPPLGLLDPASAGIVRGLFIDVVEDEKRMVLYPNGSFTIVPSVALELQPTFINPAARLRLGVPAQATPVRVDSKEQKRMQKIRVSLDDIFVLTTPSLQRQLKLRAAGHPIFCTD